MKTNEQAMERVKGGGGGGGRSGRREARGKGRSGEGDIMEEKKMGYCVYVVAQI